LRRAKNWPMAMWGQGWRSRSKPFRTGKLRPS
jgi:hypothetical protein